MTDPCAPIAEGDPACACGVVDDATGAIVAVADCGDGAPCVCGGCCHIGSACVQAGITLPFGGFFCPTELDPDGEPNPLAAVGDDPGAPGYPKAWFHYGNAGTLDVSFRIETTFRARFVGYFHDQLGGQPPSQEPSAYFQPGQEYTITYIAETVKGVDRAPVRMFYSRTHNRFEPIGTPGDDCFSWTAYFGCEVFLPGANESDLRTLPAGVTGDGEQAHLSFRMDHDPREHAEVRETLLVNGQPLVPARSIPRWDIAPGVPINRVRSLVRSFRVFDVNPSCPNPDVYRTVSGTTKELMPMFGRNRLSPCALEPNSRDPDAGALDSGHLGDQASFVEAQGGDPCAGLFPAWINSHTNDSVRRVLSDWCAPGPIVSRFFQVDEPTRHPIDLFRPASGAFAALQGTDDDWVVGRYLTNDVDLTPGAAHINFDWRMTLNDLDSDFIYEDDASGESYIWNFGRSDVDFDLRHQVEFSMSINPSAPCPTPAVADDFTCCDSIGLTGNFVAVPCSGVGDPIVVDGEQLAGGGLPSIDVATVPWRDGSLLTLRDCYEPTPQQVDDDPTPGVTYRGAQDCSYAQCGGPYVQMARCDTGALFYVPYRAVDDWLTYEVAIVSLPNFYTGCARVTGAVDETGPRSDVYEPDSWEWIDDPAGCAATVCTGGSSFRKAVACNDASGGPPPVGAPLFINADIRFFPTANVVRVLIPGLDSPAGVQDGSWCYRVFDDEEPGLPEYPAVQGYDNCTLCVGGRPIDPPIVDPPGPGQFATAGGEGGSGGLRGLGDLVERGINAATFGLVKPCAGCKERQRALNERFPFRNK